MEYVKGRGLECLEQLKRIQVSFSFFLHIIWYWPTFYWYRYKTTEYLTPRNWKLKTRHVSSFWSTTITASPQCWNQHKPGVARASEGGKRRSWHGRDQGLETHCVLSLGMFSFIVTINVLLYTTNIYLAYKWIWQVQKRTEMGRGSRCTVYWVPGMFSFIY